MTLVVVAAGAVLHQPGNDILGAAALAQLRRRAAKVALARVAECAPRGEVERERYRIGRAERILSCEVHMYSDSINASMAWWIDETNRRRVKQVA